MECRDAPAERLEPAGEEAVNGAISPVRSVPDPPASTAPRARGDKNSRSPGVIPLLGYTQEPQRAGDRKDMSWSLSITSRHAGCPTVAVRARNAVEIGRDVLAVARYLQGQPYVKASQIAAVGWSLGGGAVLAALGQLTAAENSPLRAVVAYYPYCRDLQP
jgi:hypothetical protein